MPEEQEYASKELQFAYEQLRKEILQNDDITLKILGGTLVLTGALAGFSSSAAMTDGWQRGVLFFVAAAIAVIGLFQTIDRARSSYMLASYLRIFIEPQMQYVKWEIRLHRVRGNKKYERIGYGGFFKNHLFIYMTLVGIDCLLGVLYVTRNFPVVATVLFGLTVLCFIASVCIRAEDQYRGLTSEHSQTFDKMWKEMR